MNWWRHGCGECLAMWEADSARLGITFGLTYLFDMLVGQPLVVLWWAHDPGVQSLVPATRSFHQKQSIKEGFSWRSQMEGSWSSQTAYFFSFPNKKGTSSHFQVSLTFSSKSLSCNKKNFKFFSEDLLKQKLDVTKFSNSGKIIYKIFSYFNFLQQCLLYSKK